MWARYGREFARRLVRQRYAALHHALLAATIAAVTLFAGENSYFKLGDALTRTAFSMAYGIKTIHKRFADEKPPTKDDPADRPRVVLLPDINETAASHACAADEYLAQLIVALADQRPSLLVLDLNLTFKDTTDDFVFPGASLPTVKAKCVDTPGGQQFADEPTAKPVDRAIRYAAERTRVVLLAPALPLSAASFKSWRDDSMSAEKTAFRNEELVETLNLDWIRGLCRIPNVMLGAQLDHYATVTYYISDQASPGNVAANPSLDICPFFRSGPADWTTKLAGGAFFDKLGQFERGKGLDHAVSLNPHYYDTLSQLTMFAWPQAASLASGLPHNLFRKAVFVGDGYGVHQTITLGSAPDAEADASVYYTDLHPGYTPPKFVEFLIDVLLGTVLGFLFSWTWHKSALAGEYLHRASQASVRKKIVAWAAARFLLVCNIGLLLAVMYATFIILGAIFERGTWMNPIPLILGMSLKGLLNSRQRCTSHPPQSVHDLIEEHPDVLWQPLAVAALLFFAPLA